MLSKPDRAIAKRVFLYFKPHWLLILLTIVLSIILAPIPVLLVRYIRQTLDDVFIGKQFGILIAICVGLIILFAVNCICRYFQDFITRYVSEAVSRTVRNELYEKFMGFSFTYYVKNKLGNMLSKVINDVVTLNDGLTAITILAKEPITIVALLVYAFWLDWKLMCVSILAAPFIALFFAVIGKKVHDFTRRSLERIADLSSSLQETFSGIRIIKAFILEKKMNEKFRNENLEYFKVRLGTAKIEVLSSPLTEFIGACAAAVMLYYGGSQVIHGRMSPGTFFAFIGSVGLILDPLRKIDIANIRINTALAGAKRIFEVLDHDEKIYSSPNPAKLSAVSHSVKFRDVSFSYGDDPVLDSISFEVRAGSSIAFVGASGVGKTTLVNLIPRFYDATSGEISIDGTPIKEFEVNSLRSKIALVTQETFLFNDTIYNNILYGNLTAGKEAVLQAAKAAHAHEFIVELPNGFETALGDRGMNLSGGQRQRLAIARALLKDAPILILDEATSSLDSESEKLVQKAIENLMKGRTTFLIAHRLSTVKNASRIIVLKEGRIFESGTHEELMSKRGEYHQFYRLQESTL